MTISRAEKLKTAWTDKYVSFRKGIPELRRFDGLVGQVKTVNMNCRVLVEFDTPADISWYDIDPQFLVVVDLPVANDVKAAGTVQTTSPQKTTASAAPPASSATTKAGSAASPLDQIRQQSKGKPDKPGPASSPLDQIRAQASAGEKKPAADQPASGKPSPLDLIRQQQAAANAGNSEASPDIPPAEVTEQSERAGAGSALSPLDQIRAQQGGSNAAATGGLAQRSPTTAKPSPDTDSSTARQKVDVTAVPDGVDASGTSRSGDETATPDFLLKGIESAGSTESLAGLSSGDMIAQIRRQAGEEETAGTPNLIQQIRAQAEGLGHNEVSTEVSATTTAESSVGRFRGRKLPRQDDLKIVEGIGPKIEELLHKEEITTWEQLASADYGRLTGILRDAGPRFQMHDPKTWPAQARLALENRWAELEEYQDSLSAGRE